MAKTCIIKNKMSSMLDLSAIKDIHGNPVSLRPRDGAGSSREITVEASRHEAVTRVVDAKWASLHDVEPAVAAPYMPAPTLAAPTPDVMTATVPTPASAPVSEPVPTPAPAPVSEPVPMPVSEPEPLPVVEPTPAPVVEETPVEELAPTSVRSEDAPTLGGRPSRRGR
jgi:hypothetical protein